MFQIFHHNVCFINLYYTVLCIFLSSNFVSLSDVDYGMYSALTAPNGGNNFPTSSRRDSMMASLHFSRALREANCKKPLPRVVHIGALLVSSRKKFLPHCTVLYKCSQETGCCHSEDQVCGPKSIQTVALPFWTVELTKDGQRKGVEILTFENHTECECKSIGPE